MKPGDPIGSTVRQPGTTTVSTNCTASKKLGRVPTGTPKPPAPFVISPEVRGRERSSKPGFTMGISSIPCPVVWKKAARKASSSVMTILLAPA